MQTPACVAMSTFEHMLASYWSLSNFVIIHFLSCSHVSVYIVLYQLVRQQVVN